jgi:hypothetical protein
MVGQSHVFRVAWVSSLALSSLGCGAAQTIVKKQIDDRCTAMGVRGCPEIAEGALAYVDGDKEKAAEKLKAAASKNSSGQMKKLARELTPVVDAIGGDTGNALKEVLAILAAEPAEESAEPGHQGAQPSGPMPAEELARIASGAVAPRNAPEQANLDLDRLRSGMVEPGDDPHAAPCESGLLTSDGRPCSRVRLFVGPLVVTNVFTSGGCPDELFVASGALDDPHWLLLVLPNDRANISGQFVVEDGEELYAGVRPAASPGAAEAPAHTDLRCSVVWSGYKPHGGDPTTSP